MKHKLIIVISTALVCVLTVVLALVWLMKIRYVEISVVAETNFEQELYEQIEGVMQDEFVGKSYVGVKEENIEKKITVNPYVKVKEIKKIFPDRIIVSVERRKEQFAIVYGDQYFVTDAEYFLLKKTADESQIKNDVVKITISDVNLDSSTLTEGKVVGYENDVLVGSATEIFSKFKDGFNLIDKIEIIGARNWIRFYTKTGVCLEFSFSPIGGKETVEQDFAKTLVAKTEEVQTFYNGLNESQKSEGYVIILTKESGEISILYAKEKAE